jgi:hypothetical protein
MTLKEFLTSFLFSLAILMVLSLMWLSSVKPEPAVNTVDDWCYVWQRSDNVRITVHADNTKIYNRTKNELGAPDYVEECE